MLSRPSVHALDPWVLVSRDAGGVLYNRNSQTLMALEGAVEVDALGQLIRGLGVSEADSIASRVQSRPMSQAFQPLTGGTPSALGRLTINIANACNLWCSYCYADHGQYHAASSLMAPEVAVDIVARCLKLYPTIRSVQFFGGEPLLNIDAVEEVAEHLTSVCGAGRPQFVATTNGTIASNRINDVLARYDVGLTVSLDGPSEIHDHLRPSRSPRSSHADAMANIDGWRRRGIGLDIECTYTSAHVANGISVVDLMNYFHDELDIRVPHIAWVYLPRPKKTVDSIELGNNVFRSEIGARMREHLPPAIVEKQFREAAAVSIRNIVNSSGPALSFAVDIAKRLSTRATARNYCPAFNSQLSISAQGDVFPCFMFFGDPRMNMGNIFSADFPGTRVREVWNRYADEFGALPTGDDDWCSALASGCIAGDYIASATFAERLYRPVYRAMIEEVLLGLGTAANSMPA